MTFKDFIKKQPLTSDDLYGPWKQRGLRDGIIDEESGRKAAKVLYWLRRGIKRAIKAKTFSVPPKGCECLFKRERTHEDSTCETMIIRHNGEIIATVYACGEQFSISKGGEIIQNADCEMENGRKGKSRKGKSAFVENKNVKTPAEIQASIPFELRTGWTNYELMDKINEQVCEASVKYWNEHNGKFPKRKIRKSKKEG